ncbi:glycosyltransferase [Kineothrix sp. MSJ-39]|uniref:glycosyltransferase family 2 protein n=1 Tax=Kineothrix sp. MSJ-39 TaxID=2841533 RepID=UPI001C1051DF|nr:glycosyltransferase family 2 protein [Kineothrix sp. MSJ-39]MBU5428782.1 glycosyltransferase [Kineothrix sp. MSJ-39]
MDNKDLISIIIPVYNSEKYLTECLNSIREQTYTNLQVILIDDGSKDSSGKICDDFCRKDSRFLVVHGANSGQAAARNKALEMARGEWIGFVDNDDIIDKDMYAILHQNAIINSVLISGCATLSCYEDGSTRNKYDDIESGIKDTKRIIEDIFLQTEHAWGAMWNKIYHRSLKSNLFFPEGCQLEDYDVILKLYYNVKKVYFDNRPLYHWFVREGSQSHRAFYDGKLSIIDVANGLKVWFEENCSDDELIEEAHYFAFISRMSVLSLMWMSHDRDIRRRMKQYLPSIKEVMHIINKNQGDTYRNLKFLIKCIIWHLWVV